MADQVVQRTEQGGMGEKAEIQRKCAACQQETRRQPEEGDEEVRAKDAGVPEVPAAVERRLRQQPPGQALAGDLRTRMESAFDADFSAVRLHAGPSAQEMSQELGARAFTYGQDIYFGTGELRPESRAGRRLLAHELVHTVQQGAASPRSARRAAPSRGLPQAAAPGAAVQRASEPTIMPSLLFSSTMRICHRLLKSRVFRVTDGSVTVVADADWEGVDNCGAANYPMTLTRENTFFDDELGSCYFATGRADRHTWASVPTGDYYLTIWPSNMNPHCCLTGSIEVSQQSGVQESSSCTSEDDSALEVLHAALDAAGLIPAVGIVPDAINAGIYSIEGDWLNAGISSAAMLPIFGQGATLTRQGVRVTREAVERTGREGIEAGVRSARSVRIGARFIESVLASARRSVGQGSAALRKLQRRLGDPDSLGLFRSVPLTEDAAQGLVSQILHNARTQRFGRLKMSGFAGQRGIAIFDEAGRGVLVRQTDGHFITFLEEGRALGNIFR